MGCVIEDKDARLSKPGGKYTPKGDGNGWRIVSSELISEIPESDLVVIDYEIE